MFPFREIVQNDVFKKKHWCGKKDEAAERKQLLNSFELIGQSLLFRNPRKRKSTTETESLNWTFQKLSIHRDFDSFELN